MSRDGASTPGSHTEDQLTKVLEQQAKDRSNWKCWAEMILNESRRLDTMRLFTMAFLESDTLRLLVETVLREPVESTEDKSSLLLLLKQCIVNGQGKKGRADFVDRLYTKLLKLSEKLNGNRRKALSGNEECKVFPQNGIFEDETDKLFGDTIGILSKAVSDLRVQQGAAFTPQCSLEGPLRSESYSPDRFRREWSTVDITLKERATLPRRDSSELTASSPIPDPLASPGGYSAPSPNCSSPHSPVDPERSIADLIKIERSAESKMRTFSQKLQHIWKEVALLQSQRSNDERIRNLLADDIINMESIGVQLEARSRQISAHQAEFQKKLAVMESLRRAAAQEKDIQLSVAAKNVTEIKSEIELLHQRLSIAKEDLRRLDRERTNLDSPSTEERQIHDVLRVDDQWQRQLEVETVNTKLALAFLHGLQRSTVQETTKFLKKNEEIVLEQVEIGAQVAADALMQLESSVDILGYSTLVLVDNLQIERFADHVKPLLSRGAMDVLKRMHDHRDCSRFIVGTLRDMCDQISQDGLGVESMSDRFRHLVEHCSAREERIASKVESVVSASRDALLTYEDSAHREGGGFKKFLPAHAAASATQ